MRRPSTVAIVAATTIAAILIASGCGSSGAHARTAKTNTPPPASARAEVAALLKGIPQDGTTLGDAGAPVTLEYFGDLQCPYCREFTLGALATLIQRYVRTGTLKIDYRSLESATRVPRTFRMQQTAALAAGRQNKLWNFIELFYREQGRENSGYVTEGFLQGLAQQVPDLNLLAWSVARNSPKLARVVSGDERVGIAVGFRQTPGFLFANAAGNLRVLRPPTLTNVAPYAFGVNEMLRLDRRRRQGGPLVSSS